jgi:FlaA1/EpsC-like NDP-sugar epimerase
MVDDNPSKAGMTVDGLPVLGLTRRIPTLVKDKDIGVILFAIERIHPEEQQRILNLCRGTGARLVMVPDLMEMFRERIVSDDVLHPASAADPAETRVSGPASALRELAAVRGESPQTG